MKKGARLASSFEGFEPAGIEFLEELARNNNREWFQANKARYEDDIVAPAFQFIEAMRPRIRKISRHYRAVAKKTGGSMMRIYRDIRFSKDKTPYKTHVAIHFQHEQAKPGPAPGFYVAYGPERVHLGVGVWHPDPATLAKIRAALDGDPKGWRKAREDKSFRRHFELGGESLTRPPRGYRGDHPLIEDLMRKDFAGFSELSVEELFRSRFLDRVDDAFSSARPFVRFLCRSLELPF